MSEYQISSVYFSRRNKLLLLICVFFFSCSTHVFKNVFPFLFMLTGVRNEIDLDNVANQAGRFPSRGGPLGGAAKGGGIQTDLFGQSAAYSLGRTPPTIVSEEATHSSTYLETKGRNSQSIYLYSNILTLIYCSSLVTYIFILVYDLGKKNYVINSFYIINLVAHFTIFLLLSDIQMRNTDLREVMSWRDGSLSRDAMPLFGRYPAEDMLAKRRDINFYFKRNLRDRLDAGEFLSVGLFQRSALEFVLGGVEAGGRFEAGEDKTSSDMGKDNRDGEQRNSDMGKDNRDGEQRNSDVGKDNRDTGRDNRSREEAYTYERKHLKFLYLCIIISSICSGYIKIYQKRIMYCIFYVNIGVITSLLILMNSLFKLFAHSLNYVVTNNNSITDISDYIILFLVIDMFGLLTILIFTYKWFYQRKLWVNLHTIFYNYKYVCFYHKETYYLYSVDKQIDSILVHIDMCGDENIKISFCAYMNLNKSIFYDYLRLNTFRKNKLRILEIADQSLHVTSTYKAVERPHGEHGEHSERGEVDQRGQRDEGGEVDQHGERGEGGTPSFGRKQKHSYTMKPYKICIESLSSLANVGPDEQLAEGQLRGISESIIPTVIISQIPTHLCVRTCCVYLHTVCTCIPCVPAYRVYLHTVCTYLLCAPRSPPDLITFTSSPPPTQLSVKNNESITSAFAIFELVTMIIISLNNYVFGCFLIKEEYLKGLYVLFFFVILVIVLILLLIVTIYLKKKRSARAYKSPRNADLAQPLL
ncbi:hypothetical protein PVIIG_03667 [Plasmodium vivax India VII]|uniref:Uncharacterized protein n=1 Tax=Plasmodium vivax India VII TaxID=1077284 RepID=A0A0J9SBY4_PLAVI|nr:hypothetical protein PVIIG_03667 [Plasmodium vivax India VII]